MGRNGGRGSEASASFLISIAYFFLTGETAVASDPLRSAMLLTDAFPRVSGPWLFNADGCARG